MRVSEIAFQLPGPPSQGHVLDWLTQQTSEKLPDGEELVRLVVTESDREVYRCEATTYQAGLDSHRIPSDSAIAFRKRQSENTERFNVAMLIPTGIGAAIGGHAGDATPVAQLLAASCDTLIVHPNVVNASDINEMPANSLYVEGSVLCRLIMGTAGLQPVRSNRVLVLAQAHRDQVFADLTVNAVNAARASYGLNCAGIIEMEKPLVMSPDYTGSDRAAGSVEGLE
ncbi:MAG: DUF3326 domain-containing protein, partial [Chloroflexi bacterium]|nr:DUF3326 domain-containing protein [Chloroflexota bacterium]